MQREPIAIIGIGCRLPGEASSPSRLWDLLVQNRSGHGQVPPERYNAEAYYHPDAERPGSINSTGGYFIQEDVHAFDNAFFGINNLEATYMDAQQRKLLEVVYESFESAGVPLQRIQGSKTGVYVGNFTNDYMIMQYKDPEYFSRYSATGAGPTVLSNRITHCFDLHGPSVVLDTACSSSLYALHSACLALDAYDCDAAVVASANLIQSPEQQLIAVKAGILSPDSTCHTFDEAANGYGRAEGVSALYLKRLSDAIRDKDPIRSVIRGTAVNGNGKTPGIVQPSVDGQEAVIQAAYRRAGLPTDETDYIEAHGTGTKVGDPIEVEAISRVFRHKTGRPTLVGGIKPNLGHSEGASGLSSIIKVTLALEKGVIPATVGVKNINPSIKTKEWNVEIATTNQPWPASAVPRASVNSFGFGGANSHAILEAATAHISYDSGRVLNGNCYINVNGNGNVDSHASSTNGAGKETNKLHLITLSAGSENSLTQMAKSLAAYTNHHHVDVRDLAFTLSCRRSKLSTRGFLLASQSTLHSDLDPSKMNVNVRGTGFSATLPFTFVYTGQGAQWPGMGIELLKQNTVFRNSIRYLDSCLQALDAELSPSWTIEATLLASAEESNINLAEKSQPICTAVQIALTDLLRDWGILPETVVGHSSGEMAAAYAAGLLTARQAILAAFCRGKAVSNSTTNKGAMMAVGLGGSRAQEIVTELELQESITVACLNSPESTTLSGDDVAIEKVLKVLQERNFFARKLRTGGKAYHSHHMKLLGSKYQELLERVWEVPNGSTNSDAKNYVNGKVPSVRMISTVTGHEATPDQVASPEYWRLNLESPVRFEEAVKIALESGKCHFLEVGPHSSLELPIKQTASALNKAQDHYLYSSALVRGKDAGMTVLNLVGSLFLHGHDEIKYENILVIDESEPKVLLDLPPYPWDYSASTLWTEPRSVTEFRNRKYPRHDLLGSQLPGGNKSTTTWRNVLDINEVSWLKDHCLGPSIVFPAAAYVAMAVEAMCQVAGLQLHECPGVELRNVNFVKALDMHPERQPKVEIFTEMRQAPLSSTTNSDRWWHFSVVSISGDDSHPTTHVNGLVSLPKNSLSMTQQLRLNKDTMEQQATRVWYEKFSKEGLNWGPQFAVMEEIFCDRARQAQQASATTHLLRGDTICSSEGRSRSQYIAHPISIDAMLQTAFVATTGGWVRELRATVPVTMDWVHVSAPALLDMDTMKPWSIDTVSERVGFGTVKIDAELYNASGQVLIRMSSVRCIAYQGNVQTDPPEQRNPLVRVAWKPDITTLTTGVSCGLSKYLDWFTEDCRARGVEADEGSMRVAGALDLAAHKQPNAHILELSGQTGTTELMLSLLRANSPLRRFSSYVRGGFSESGELLGSEVILAGSASEKNGTQHAAIPQDKKFDIILVCSEHEMSTSYFAGWLAPGAIVITTGDASHITSSKIHYEKVIQESGRSPISVTLAMTSRPSPAKDKARKPDVVFVTREGTISGLEAKIKDTLEGYFGSAIPVVGLSQVSSATVPDRSIVVSTLEVQQPLLSVISEQEMDLVKIITDRVAKILWISNGNILTGSRPDFALVLGLSRALMLEQPSLQFAVLGLDNISSGFDTAAQNVLSVMHQLIHDGNPDFEFAQKEGLVHILRWEPEESLNAQFRLKQDDETVDVALEHAGRCELSIKNPGQMDTIRFVRKEYQQNALASDQVEIQVKSVGMNAKDLYVLSAKVDTKDVSCSCECAGIVTAVGAEVTNFKPGDRVVAMAPGHFATVERFPQWAVCKLQDDEEFTTASTIPIVFSTVLYGLKYRANLQAGESILIHSAAGGVGIAAIQLAKHLGAKVIIQPVQQQLLWKEFELADDMTDLCHRGQ
ncbi:hypothetical protein VTN77DRAFT_2872 [Rasamsonia byssochlamydoides]|uniref:uncharacterized protein n=1 Tax=Rasamsonia byssochlamydoides TaxID=89139 RepID=UPI003743E1A5